MFIALETQWKWHPMAGVRTGLDYSAITPIAAMTGIAVTPALFADLRIMEAAALQAWSK